MKKAINLIFALSILVLACSCVKPITPDLPDDNANTELPDDSDSPSDMDNNESGQTPDPRPEPEGIFQLLSENYREIYYTGCNIRGQVKTNVGLIVEIPQDCDWIILYDGYNTSDQGIFGLTISSLPETTNHCEHDSFLFDWCCSGEDRECVITLWDSDRTRHEEMKIKQLCFGCSCGLEQGSDIVVEY